MRYKLLLTALATLLAIGVGWIASGEATFTGTTTLVTQGGSTVWSVSADGRYATFGNGWLYDRLTGTPIRIDPSFQGGEMPVISADGRYVAFQAYWYPEGGDGRLDVFVRDLQTGETMRVSVDSQGNPANDISGIFPSAISADGRYVAFFSFATNLVPQGTPRWGDIFVHDRVTGQTELVSVDSNGNRPSNGNSCAPAISADGRYVAFYSNSSDLVSDDTNNSADIFVHDRETGETTRVSVDSAGNEANRGGQGAPSISADGRYVAFFSMATNLVSGDNEGAADVFIHDLLTGQTELVSVSSDGVPGDDSSDAPSISSNGRYVAFESRATNLAPVGTPPPTQTPTPTDTPVWTPTVAAGTPMPTSTPTPPAVILQVYLRDRQTGQTTQVSVDDEGNCANGSSFGPLISGDGRYVAFMSNATNLAPGAGSGGNIFLHDRGTEIVTVQANADDTVTTDTDGVGATASDPVETYVTVRNAGTVSIDEGPITADAPHGFEFVTQQVNVSAPAATIDDPLVIVFRLDSSQVPPGKDQNTTQIFKSGVQVAPCTGPLGTASPDPCVSNRVLLPDGDIGITVLTSTASPWNLGVASGPSAPVGGNAEYMQNETKIASGSAASTGPTLAGLAAGGALLLMAGGWYARRRWLS